MEEDQPRIQRLVRLGDADSHGSAVQEVFALGHSDVEERRAVPKSV